MSCFLHAYKSLADLEGGGCYNPPPLQISKKKESNKTKQKKKKTILLKRNKRERVACLSCFYVYTRWYVYQQSFFFQNFPPQPHFEKFLDPRLEFICRLLMPGLELSTHGACVLNGHRPIVHVSLVFLCYECTKINCSQISLALPT